jgi:hypothetical protein
MSSHAGDTSSPAHETPTAGDWRSSVAQWASSSGPSRSSIPTSTSGLARRIATTHSSFTRSMNCSIGSPGRGRAPGPAVAVAGEPTDDVTDDVGDEIGDAPAGTGGGATPVLDREGAEQLERRSPLRPEPRPEVDGSTELAGRRRGRDASGERRHAPCAGTSPFRRSVRHRPRVGEPDRAWARPSSSVVGMEPPRPFRRPGVVRRSSRRVARRSSRCSGSPPAGRPATPVRVRRVGRGARVGPVGARGPSWWLVGSRSRARRRLSSRRRVWGPTMWGVPSGRVHEVVPSRWRATVQPPSWTDRWWYGQIMTRFSTMVGPPSAQCTMWCAWRWCLASQPGNVHHRSRRTSRRRSQRGAVRSGDPTATGYPAASLATSWVRQSHVRRRNVSLSVGSPDPNNAVPAGSPSPSTRSRSASAWITIVARSGSASAVIPAAASSSSAVAIR